MDMLQAAVFMSASILVMIGLVVITAGLVAINMLLNKYWKPVKILSFYENQSARFVTEEEHKELKSKK